MIISIASGKGGTGKTTIATNLVFSLAQKDNCCACEQAGVQLLDCDVEEPNAHIFIKPKVELRETVFLDVPQIDEEKCTHCGECAKVCAYNAIFVADNKVILFPQLCHSCGGCSYFCPQNAISEVGHEIGEIVAGSAYGIEFAYGKLNIGEIVAPPLIKKLKERINEDKVVIMDAPPGTSCPVIEAVKGSDFCLLVTEPTPFGLNDLKLAVEMLKVLKVPFAVLINRWNEEYFEIDSYCDKENIPILTRIPLERKIAEVYSEGNLFSKELPEWQETFCKLFDSIVELSK